MEIIRRVGFLWLTVVVGTACATAREPVSKESATIAAESKETFFLELPPDLPLPSSPGRGAEWLKNALVIQPWGYTQKQMMHVGMGDLPAKLKAQYGFNTLCVMPPAALKEVGGGGQSDSEFTDTLEAYRKAGYKIILYSSLVNVGHDPAWNNTLKQHPEWRQIDASGRSKNWLCPNTASSEQALEYTRQIIANFGADGIMLDNNAFMDTGTGSPACYCRGCESSFSKYVGDRFGAESHRYFGLKVEEVQVPRSAGALYGLWKHWRNRTWVEAMERARKALPEVALFANTQFWYWTSGSNGWVLAHDLLYRHEDALLSESYFMEPKAVSSKLLLGRALAANKPLFDLVGTFEWRPPKFAPLKPAQAVSRLTAAALAHNANPWLGYYGMEGEQGDESRKALAQLLQFRAAHPEFYDDLRQRGSVCSILPLRSYTLLGTGHPVVPAHVGILNGAGMGTTGLCDFRLDDEPLALARILVAENASCLSAAEAVLLANWVQNGGVLVATDDLGTFDEIGRRRPRSIVAEKLGVNALKSARVKRGELIVVPREELASSVIKMRPERIEALDVPPGTVEVRSCDRSAAGPILHVINYGADMATPWKLRLPSELASAIKRPILRQPGREGAVPLKLAGSILELPPMRAYAVIVSADE